MRYFKLALALCIGLAACRKSDREKDTDIGLLQDAFNAYSALGEAFLAVHEANLTTPGIKSSFISCCSLAVDTLGIPRNQILDFGGGCVSPTGRTRMGKIIVYQNGYYSVSGSTSTVYFDSFYINGYLFSGSFSITSIGTGYKISTSSLVVKSGNTSFSYSGTISLISVAGTSTIVADDDEFNVSGTLTLTGSNGNSATCLISGANPALFKGTCAELVSGNMEITPSNLATRQLELGSGNCDQLGTTTLNGENYDITLSF